MEFKRQCCRSVKTNTKRGAITCDCRKFEHSANLRLHGSRRDAVSAVGQRDSVPFILKCKFKALSPVPYTWWQKPMPAPCQIDLHREFATLLSVSLYCNQWHQHKRSVTMNIPPPPTNTNILTHACRFVTVQSALKWEIYSKYRLV